MAKSPTKNDVPRNDLAIVQIDKVNLETQVVLTTIHNTAIYRNFIRYLPLNTALGKL